MRFAIVAGLVFAHTPFAAAQTPFDLERQYSLAEYARGLAMADAGKAVASNDWTTACESAKLVYLRTHEMSELLTKLRDARDARDELDGADFDNMSIGIIQLMQEAEQLKAISAEVCTKADE